MRSEITALPLFDAPVSVPVAPRSETSRQAAIEVQPKAGSQAAKLFSLYQREGPQTDHEAAQTLGLPLSSVCARRNWLMQQDRVEAKETKLGPYGVLNQRYGVK